MQEACLDLRWPRLLQTLSRTAHSYCMADLLVTPAHIFTLLRVQHPFLLMAAALAESGSGLETASSGSDGSSAREMRKEDGAGVPMHRAVLVQMPDDGVCCGVELTPQEGTPVDMTRQEVMPSIS